MSYSQINYPLDVSFKLIAVARQLSVIDANGALLFYVKQKAFKLKEAVTVFADREQQLPLYEIAADRVIDFSARYRISDAAGVPLGEVARGGMRSLWKTHYEIADAAGAPVFTVSEENAWTKVLDNLLGEVPVLGMFTGYLFHPAYIVSRANAAPALRIVKQPAMFEGKFRIERLAQLGETEERLALLSLLMMVLLERKRG